MRSQLFIDGSWVDPVAGSTLPVVDPATERVVHRAPAATAVDVGRACRAARRAFETGWGDSSGASRATYLDAIAARIIARREELADLEVLDNGKPLPEALWDIDDAAGCFSMYASLARELDEGDELTVAVPDERFRSVVRSVPVGVAGLIVPGTTRS
ncbi:MAG: aldehyde dehydrogenase family protein [Thermoanaerobaculia bacterium]